MPVLSCDRLPAYRRHRASGRAIVTLSGVDHYLGPWNSAASKSEYSRLIAEWLAGGRRPRPAPEEGTIVELLAAYLRHCKSYYRNSDGTMSREMERVKLSIPLLSTLYGRAAVSEFSPIALKAIRQRMVESGLARNTINQRIDCIRRVFRWGVSEELVPPNVLPRPGGDFRPAPWPLCG